MNDEPRRDSTARLLVQCPDRPGIVAAVSQFLFAHGANIVQADQFSSLGGRGRFFMRTEFELGGLDAPVRRLAAMDVPVPFSPPLEDVTVPTPDVVAQTARELCNR